MRPGQRRRCDAGAAEALALVLFFPVMLGLALLVMYLGRQVDANAQVQAASDAAAQAAAVQRTASAASAAANQMARAMLVDATACAGGAEVHIDAQSWAPGGTVTVAVTCHPRRDDLGLLQPPARDVSATSTARIDAYRAVGLP